MVVGVVLGLLAILATANRGQGRAPDKVAPDKVTVQLKWVTQVQFAGYYAAKQKGLYGAEQLDVTIRPGGPDIVPERVVADGGAQFGLDWLPSLGRRHQTWMMAEINKLIWGPPRPTTPLGKMDPAAFKRTADIALKFGVIKKPADASAYTHEIWGLAQKKG